MKARLHQAFWVQAIPVGGKLEQRRCSPSNVLIIEDSDEEDSEPEPPKPRPKSKKSILKLIEDSDEDEPDPEEELVRLKDNKIVDFLEPPEEGVSFLE